MAKHSRPQNRVTNYTINQDFVTILLKIAEVRSYQAVFRSVIWLGQKTAPNIAYNCIHCRMCATIQFLLSSLTILVINVIQTILNERPTPAYIHMTPTRKLIGYFCQLLSI